MSYIWNFVPFNQYLLFCLLLRPRQLIFSISMSLMFLDSTYKCDHIVFFSLWLISLRIMPLKSMVWNLVGFSSFLMIVYIYMIAYFKKWMRNTGGRRWMGKESEDDRYSERKLMNKSCTWVTQGCHGLKLCPLKVHMLKS